MGLNHSGLCNAKENGQLTHDGFEQLSSLLTGAPVTDLLCSSAAAEACFISWPSIMDDNMFIHFS